MSQVKAEKTTKRTGGKKLTLRKQTLKDLTAKAGRAKRVRGGAIGADCDQALSFQVSGCL